MTKVLSQPFSVTVSATQQSRSLAQLAASMVPGTWAQLNVTNQNSILGVGDHSGSMMHYAMSCAWNAHNNCIEIVGADHMYGCMRYVRFDGNQFVLINAGGGDDDGLGGVSGLGGGHEFNGLACNPYTGDCYYRPYTGLVGSGHFMLRKCPLNGTDFRNAMPNTADTVVNIVAGSCWWTGAFTGAGPQGCYVIFNAGNSSGQPYDGQILAFDPLTNSWFFDTWAMAPFYPKVAGAGTYHEVMAYSAVKNCAVYGGGNAAPNSIWRLNADHSFTAMPDVPAGKALGIQHGNIVADPVTGNFLLLSASPGELWELNPTGSGTWAQQTGSRTPPAGVGTPGSAPFDGSGQTDGIQSCAIPDYGIIAYIKQSTSTNSSFYLYKHA